jgi:hypothetical protein
MAITSNATTLTFNNGSTQTVAPVNTNANVNSVSAGTGISVSATTGALTVTNAGVTSLSAAGTVTVSASTGGITITGTGGSGTVTSVATGNGLQGGTITGSGTLSVACPAFNTVGSYVQCSQIYNNGNEPGITASGATIAAGGSSRQLVSSNMYAQTDPWQIAQLNNLSGTWRWMSASMGSTNANVVGIACRVS